LKLLLNICSPIDFACSVGLAFAIQFHQFWTIEQSVIYKAIHLCVLGASQLWINCFFTYFGLRETVLELLSILFGWFTFFNFLSSISADLFDWQAEMSVPATPPKAVRVVTPPPPVASLVISFARALTTSTKDASNDNLPQPLIRGERVSIKITQNIYEKGMAFCKTNLRGRLVMNKGDKPYATKEIQSKLQKLWKTTGAWSMTSLGRGY